MNVKSFGNFTPLGNETLSSLRGGDPVVELPDAAGGGRKPRGKGKDQDVPVADLSLGGPIRGDRD